jgi:hypothetical protein
MGWSRGDAESAEGIVVLERVEPVDGLDARGSVLILGLRSTLRALRASARARGVRWRYTNPCSRAYRSPSMAAPRALAVSPLGIT